jgi:antibiotic biosynthesis monooxygenase (ABM) superfamily enzyme
LCGVYPTSLLLSFTIVPLIKTFPVMLRIFITAICMVCLLTWVVMPLIIKLVKPWLQDNN